MLPAQLRDAVLAGDHQRAVRARHWPELPAGATQSQAWK